MNIQIVTPAKAGTTLGNRITAERWSEIMEELGHRARVVSQLDAQWPTDVLVALHASRSSSAINEWKKLSPAKALIVCLTGTDLHRDLAGEPESREYQLAANSLTLADRVVLLEPAGIETLEDAKLRAMIQSKAAVIYQSGELATQPAGMQEDCFEVTLIGHLREVKDPFLAALACDALPADSKVRVVHIGSALDEEMEQKARLLSDLNPRYQWLGATSHSETLNRMAGSRLTLLTSRIEGAPGVISEAIVNGVPVLATRIPATLGMLGDSYEGLFPVGDVAALTGLLVRAERDSGFLGRLKEQIKNLSDRYARSTEVSSWSRLLERNF